MKKIFIIAFALVGTVFLAGCETPVAPEAVMVSPEPSSDKL